MKFGSTLLAVLVVMLISSCSRTDDSIVVDGYYASKNEDGTFSVSKVLAVDDLAVHVRIYKNRFPALPEQLDTSVLSLGRLGEPGGFGIGHAPIAREGWLASHTFLKKEPVREEELEGYRYYLEAMRK